MSEVIKAYKAFNKDMTCRDFTFEEGKEYETDKAIICKCGFHACEMPLEILRHYKLTESVFHEVELSGEVSHDDDKNTKIAATKIKIGRELTLDELRKAQIKYVSNAGGYMSTNAGGDGSTNAGGNGSTNAGGNGSTNAGGNGSTNAGGYMSTNAGGYMRTNAGGNGSTNAGGDGSTNAGGNMSTNAGGNGSINAGGARSINAGGNRSINAGRGICSGGENSLCVARGNGCKVKGGIGSILVIAKENDCDYNIKFYKAVIVDGEKVKADTWYKLSKEGELIEVRDECLEK